MELPARRRTGTIADIEHIVILMQENRSFDHYFGSLRGVRGFADRHPIPLAGGKKVWRQMATDREIMPFHLDSRHTRALKVESTPHNFGDAQAAWDQGRLANWARFKTPLSMGHYRRQDLPFQYALADAFTICDAYHCSVQAGTDPNRIMFWSGANFDPRRRAEGLDATDAYSEPVNLRCWVKGALPEPGYSYQGSPFTWATIPDVLEAAGISWRIYQDPNDNWTGAMHGGLAFQSFRSAQPGSSIYENGMRGGWLDRLANDVRTGALPQVSWVLPSQAWSEHPAGSSPIEGAEFTARVLDSITANPEVWSRTALVLTFDENDGFFDHVPPPAPPSLDNAGQLLGGSTLPLEGMYFQDRERRYIAAGDRAPGVRRPWGLGPRVPTYVISPWSKGGWVDSQVYDHTSVGQLIEKRFGVTVPAISPWHRAVCGDLTGAFDFAADDQRPLPAFPRETNIAARVLSEAVKSEVVAENPSKRLFQEAGVRPSRPLPYTIEVDSGVQGAALVLRFRNMGQAGAVFHVYDRLHLDRIPRRYTVERGKIFEDRWPTEEGGNYDLWVYGPNGFVRKLSGNLSVGQLVDVALTRDARSREMWLDLSNRGSEKAALIVRANQYALMPAQQVELAGGARRRLLIALSPTHGWYDISAKGRNLFRRFAGREENGEPSISDPLARIA